MTNEEQQQLARDINAAMRGGGAPSEVKRPDPLSANATEGQRRKFDGDSAAYTDYLLKKQSLTQDEMVWLATGVRAWDKNGRQ